MKNLRRWVTHPALALGGTLIGGLVELLALARSRGAAWLRAAIEPERQTSR
ncbi:MAG TPA: hypothetical protein VGQ91_11920 [Ideonella sp.]|jgi:hypothetical protein|nr:hypothetical protein [Ideonella sp.]